MEIVDSRIEDWRIKLADTVADLASNGAMAMSSPDRAARPGRHPAGRHDATRNGELVDTGAGAAALGDPLAVVAWLANVLGEQRHRARAGTPGHDRRAARRRTHGGRATSSAPTSTGSARSRQGGWSDGSTPTDAGGAPRTRPARSITAIPQLSRRRARARPRDRLRRPAAAARGRGPLVGWKLGVTSRAKQPQVGVDSPDLRLPRQRDTSSTSASRSTPRSSSTRAASRRSSS